MMVNDVFGCEKKEYDHRLKKKATYDGYDLSHYTAENSKHVTPPPFPGGVLPYMGYIGVCGPKGCGFSAVLIVNRVSIKSDIGHFGHK